MQPSRSCADSLKARNRRMGICRFDLRSRPVDTEENIIEALNEKPVAIYDVSTDTRLRYRKEAEEEGLKSMLTLPIVGEG